MGGGTLVPAAPARPGVGDAVPARPGGDVTGVPAFTPLTGAAPAGGPPGVVVGDGVAGLGVGVAAAGLSASDPGVADGVGCGVATPVTGSGAGDEPPRREKMATTTASNTNAAATPIHIIGTGCLAGAFDAGALADAGAGAFTAGVVSGRIVAPEGAATVRSGSLDWGALPAAGVMTACG